MSEFFTPERINLILRAVLTLAIGIPILYLLKGLVKKLVTGKMSIQAGRLVVKAVFYIGFIIILAMVLNEFGFKLSALLGAAGILGVALGFAAQTSVSNLISGFFLIAEKPFEIGDVIQVGSTTGFVESIDSLSIKVKTFDNQFVRVPNENMIKTEVTNITRFPKRRVNLDVSVAYKEDLKRCVAILKEIAAEAPLALKDPEPITMLTSFGDSGINILFGVWCNTSDYFALKSDLIIRVKERYDAENIEIPFPHVSIYAGEASGPIKISNQESKEV